MNKLEETILQEELKKLEELNKKSTFHGIEIGSHDWQENHPKKIKLLEDEEIIKMTDVNYKQSWQRKCDIDNSINRIKMVLESIKLNQK